jgi:hypothetical protein
MYQTDDSESSADLPRRYADSIKMLRYRSTNVPSRKRPRRCRKRTRSPKMRDSNPESEDEYIPPRRPGLRLRIRKDRPSSPFKANTRYSTESDPLRSETPMTEIVQDEDSDGVVETPQRQNSEEMEILFSLPRNFPDKSSREQRKQALLVGETQRILLLY